MKNSAAKRNNDLHKNKNARQTQAARFLYENAGFGSRAERKCAAQNRKGVFLTDFVVKFTRHMLQYHEAGVNLS
ncbi:hypothetical protein L0337_36775 [candidate division KSB1 bacterium]|nr:hypothetical protein [candidate division KSB1 bacterium]